MAKTQRRGFVEVEAVLADLLQRFGLLPVTDGPGAGVAPPAATLSREQPARVYGHSVASVPLSLAIVAR